MPVSDLTIDGLGPLGDGICESPQGRVFVERALPGETVKARLFQDKQKVWRGELVEILAPSEYRKPAPCVHYDVCGGCSLQHLKDDIYRQWKTEMVRAAFTRQKLRPREWKPTFYSGPGTRRRGTFSLSKKGRGFQVGYYLRRSDAVSDIDSCLVLDSELLAFRSVLKSVFEPLVASGSVVDVFLQKIGDWIDMVIVGPIGRHREPTDAVLEQLEEGLSDTSVARVSWAEREKDEAQALFFRTDIEAHFGGLQVALPPAAFLQPTPEGESALVQSVLSELPMKGKFADLFSGCGTFSGHLLARGPVDAFEVSPAAVKALSEAGRGKPLRVFRRDLFQKPLRPDELNRYDAVILDPPRAGCPEQVAELSRSKVGVVVAVSCNPATLVRDARVLCDGGYWLQSVQVIDQFLWSHHVEAVAVFTKRKKR